MLAEHARKRCIAVVVEALIAITHWIVPPVEHVPTVIDAETGVGFIGVVNAENDQFKALFRIVLEYFLQFDRPLWR